MYSAGRPAHAHYLLNALSWSSTSRIQLEDVLKLIFYMSHIRAVHTSYAPPLLLPVFSIWFFLNPFHYCSHQWWRLIYCCTYWLFAIHPYDNSFYINSTSNWLVQILQSSYFSVLKPCLGDSTGRLGHFISLFKNNCFMFP